MVLRLLTVALKLARVCLYYTVITAMAQTYFYRKRQTSARNLVVTNVCNFLLFCPSPIPALHPHPHSCFAPDSHPTAICGDIIFQYNATHKT